MHIDERRHFHDMSISRRLLGSKRKGDALDVLVFLIIVVVVLAFFGFIAL